MVLKIHGKGAFLNTFKPRARGYKVGKYGATICIDKSDSETVAKLNAGFQQAAVEKWGGNPPPNYKIPLKDGDAASANRNFRGHYYLEAHSKSQPIIVDRKKQQINSGQEFPNGCECNFVITLSAYEVDGNVGITCYLSAVQYIQNGTWVNTNNVADLFDVLGDEDN